MIFENKHFLTVLAVCLLMFLQKLKKKVTKNKINILKNQIKKQTFEAQIDSRKLQL